MTRRTVRDDERERVIELVADDGRIVGRDVTIKGAAPTLAERVAALEARGPAR